MAILMEDAVLLSSPGNAAECHAFICLQMSRGTYSLGENSPQ